MIENTKNRNRINWIDVAKFIGIFFIVFGHVLSTGITRRLIFAFHVPLFFFLSGVTFTRGANFFRFIFKKFKTLLIPYYVFSVLSIFIFNLMVKFVTFEDSFNMSLLHQIGIVMYGNSRPDIMKWNTPLWFLPCLFGVLLICYFVDYISEKVGGRVKIIIQFGFVIIFLFGGICLQENCDVRLPLQLESGFFMAGFTVLGLIFRQSNLFYIKVTKANRIKLIVFASICIILGCFASDINGFAEVRIYAYGQHPVLFVLSSLSLGLATIIFAFYLQDIKILQLLGKSSLIIMCLHKFPCVFFKSICPAIKDILNKSEGVSLLICAFLVSIIIMIMCFWVQVIIDRCVVLIRKR